MADRADANFRGIELRDFPAEIARLALIIAEFQCDVLYRGPKLALAEFLPLNAENWITCGNALRLNWLSICPPTGTGVKNQADDLFHTPLVQTQIDFENEGGETFVCGNPPYSGKGKKEAQHLEDMDFIFSARTDKYGYVDYVGCWFVLAADYCRSTNPLQHWWPPTQFARVDNCRNSGLRYCATTWKSCSRIFRLSGPTVPREMLGSPA
jgi:MmeI, DNA-methyltransferase domain